MGHFMRAVRLALQYRFTLLGAIFSSLMVAVLWGGNIGAVYPFFEVVLTGKSMPGWIDEKIAENVERQAALQKEIEELERETTGVSSNQRLNLLKQRLQAEQAGLQTARWFRPYAHAYFPDSPFATLAVIIGLLLLGTVVKDLFIVTNMNFVERLSQSAVHELRCDFFARTLNMEVSHFGETGTSELMSRFTNDTQAVAAGISAVFGSAVREPLKMISCLVLAAMVSWQLLVISLLITPPAALLIRWLAKKIKKSTRRALDEMSSLYRLLGEAFSGIQAVKAFTMEGYEQRRFKETSTGFMKRSLRIVFYYSLTKPATEVIGIGVISIAILAGAYLVLEQETHILGIRISERPMSIGALLMFYGLLAGAADPARRLTEIFNQIQRGTAAADRIFQFYDLEPKVKDPSAPLKIPAPHRELLFESIKFHYQPSKPVLNGISLRVKYGETIAVVGPNGCGKSTLVGLIPRFYDPVEGAIKIGGVDVRDVSLEELRRRIGMVTQRTLLFDDTVANNIRYGSPDASQGQVIDAARQAHAHEFIENKLEHGYDTLVGEGGNRLSGGQRQRVALARAILRDPEILILDEATSQIDLESEQLIHDTLRNFTRDRTAIMITHRFSTLGLADRIIVLGAGHILDMGTHHELIARCDAYARLYEAQFRKSA